MTLQTASFRARPSVMVAALSTLNSSPHAAIADPKAIDAVPPRDLSGTYMSLGLDDHPGAVCVQVTKLSPDEMAAAKKRFNIDTGGNSYGLGIVVNDKGFGNKDGLSKGVSISHHHEPRRVAGTPDIRGEHVAVH